MRKRVLRTCEKGHRYFRSSDCPVCPVCERERAPAQGFLTALKAPARRALESAGIRTLSDLAQYRENEILELHGMGPASMPILRRALADASLHFRK